MAYTKEQIKGFEAVVKKVIASGTINKEDRATIENVLTYLTGQNWKGRCMGCSMGKIAKILRAYHDKLNAAIPVPEIDISSASGEDVARPDVEDLKAKQVEYRNKIAAANSYMDSKASNPKKPKRGRPPGGRRGSAS